MLSSKNTFKKITSALMVLVGVTLSGCDGSQKNTSPDPKLPASTGTDPFASKSYTAGNSSYVFAEDGTYEKTEGKQTVKYIYSVDANNNAFYSAPVAVRYLGVNDDEYMDFDEYLENMEAMTFAELNGIVDDLIDALITGNHPSFITGTISNILKSAWNLSEIKSWNEFDKYAEIAISRTPELEVPIAIIRNQLEFIIDYGIKGAFPYFDAVTASTYEINGSSVEFKAVPEKANAVYAPYLYNYKASSPVEVSIPNAGDGPYYVDVDLSSDEPHILIKTKEGKALADYGITYDKNNAVLTLIANYDGSEHWNDAMKAKFTVEAGNKDLKITFIGGDLNGNTVTATLNRDGLDYTINQTRR